jgi:hypothetical protein
MDLFDGYFDPEQFEKSGGMLARLLALQQQQGQDQSGATFNRTPPAPQTLITQLMRWPSPPGFGPLPGEQAATSNLVAQYRALRPVLGDRNAMIAAIHSDIGRILIAQALAQQSETTASIEKTDLSG